MIKVNGSQKYKNQTKTRESQNGNSWEEEGFRGMRTRWEGAVDVKMTKTHYIGVRSKPLPLSLSDEVLVRKQAGPCSCEISVWSHLVPLCTSIPGWITWHESSLCSLETSKVRHPLQMEVSTGRLFFRQPHHHWATISPNVASCGSQNLNLLFREPSPDKALFEAALCQLLSRTNFSVLFFYF